MSAVAPAAHPIAEMLRLLAIQRGQIPDPSAAAPIVELHRCRRREPAVSPPKPSPVAVLPTPEPTIPEPPGYAPDPRLPHYVPARYAHEITGPHGWVAVKDHKEQWRWTVAMSTIRRGRGHAFPVIWVRNPYNVTAMRLVAWPASDVHWQTVAEEA